MLLLVRVIIIVFMKMVKYSNNYIDITEEMLEEANYMPIGLKLEPLKENKRTCRFVTRTRQFFH